MVSGALVKVKVGLGPEPGEPSDKVHCQLVITPPLATEVSLKVTEYGAQPSTRPGVKPGMGCGKI